MRAIVAAAFALMLASPAYASDYYSDVAYDWTGVYGGVHAGFIQANINVDGRPRTIQGQPSIDDLELSYERDVDGFVGGALGGVNFQAGSFVFGLDMDFGGVAADGSGSEHLEGTEEKSSTPCMASPVLPRSGNSAARAVPAVAVAVRGSRSHRHGVGRDNAAIALISARPSTAPLAALWTKLAEVENPPSGRRAGGHPHRPYTGVPLPCRPERSEYPEPYF